MPGKRYSRRSVTARKRRYDWVQSTIDEQSSGAGTQALLNLVSGMPTDQLSDIANFHRLLGEFVFVSNNVNTHAYGRFGIIAVSGDASSAGAVPELIGDFEAPWWYNTAFATAGDLVVQHVPIDSKINRRFHRNEALQFVLDIAAGSNAITWGLHLRILYSHK